MHFPTLTTITALLFGLALASPAAPFTHTAAPAHGNTPTHFTPDPATPPGHINTAPYGHPNTFFHGLAEAQAHNNTLKARQVAGVYGCSQENFHGVCSYTIASGGLCHNWPWGPYSSFGPDHGIHCMMFDGVVCLGPSSGQISWPGLTAVENVLWKGAQSYRCHWA